MHVCVRNDASVLLEVMGKREGRINTCLCVRNDASVLLEVRGKREGRINTYMCVSEMMPVFCWRLGGSEKGE